MAALPNIGGAVCSTPQGLADAHCGCAQVSASAFSDRGIVRRAGRHSQCEI